MTGVGRDGVVVGQEKVGRYSKDEISSSVEVWLEIDRASVGLAFVQGLVLGK